MSFWRKWFGPRETEAPEPAPARVSPAADAGAPEPHVVSTVVEGPGGTSGFFERAFDPVTGTVKLRYAFRDDLPAWIDGVGVPLVPGKGTPIHTYVTLRAMKQLGIGLGEARAFKLCAIHEVESIVHLDWLTARHPGKPLGDLAKETHSFQYAETPIIQSGHRVVAVRVDSGRAVRRPIDDLMTHYERMAGDPAALGSAHDAILKRYERARADEMLIGYDLHIEVKPWT